MMGGSPGAPVPGVRAPAKVNLSLHVLGRRADGYHALESFVAFAGVGDHVFLEPGGIPGLSVRGPGAEAAGPAQDNLVLRAASALARRVPGLTTGHFHLIKRLPVAAGLGGGSSDAAAALRLLALVNDLPVSDARLREAAVETGSDVAVCLDPRARFMRGRGEEVGGHVPVAPLWAVLVNPRVAVATGPVFAALGLAPGEKKLSAKGHPVIAAGMERETLIAALKKSGNDMEDAAALQAPVIVDVLAVLSAAPGCRLARMSGSGATCFGLFDDRRRAVRAARAIRHAQPHWWVCATILR